MVKIDQLKIQDNYNKNKSIFSLAAFLRNIFFFNISVERGSRAIDAKLAFETISMVLGPNTGKSTRLL